MEDNVLGYALESILKELGCSVEFKDSIAIITMGSRRLRLEKRGHHWYDLEKNLWFYSRTQIPIYMVRGTL